ncbi:hypothetical protein A0H81_09326 [Grifola frondosa]|uniref:Uncharacterized protein n=1 Tax=Grifola frondosa TaxID=5627 RepID=A0A1C7M3G7_GRIFR|nr:hypothetical protein A0H81_09326 [Grifola frondosa]
MVAQQDYAHQAVIQLKTAASMIERLEKFCSRYIADYEKEKQELQQGLTSARDIATKDWCSRHAQVSQECAAIECRLKNIDQLFSDLGPSAGAALHSELEQ